ncbi:unnamed protein product, partial [Ectocarpus sp. 13 AM-2016]
ITHTRVPARAVWTRRRPKGGLQAAVDRPSPATAGFRYASAHSQCSPIPHEGSGGGLPLTHRGDRRTDGGIRGQRRVRQAHGNHFGLGGALQSGSRDWHARGVSPTSVNAGAPGRLFLLGGFASRLDGHARRGGHSRLSRDRAQVSHR